MKNNVERSPFPNKNRSRIIQSRDVPIRGDLGCATGIKCVMCMLFGRTWPIGLPLDERQFF